MKKSKGAHPQEKGSLLFVLQAPKRRPALCNPEDGAGGRRALSVRPRLVILTPSWEPLVTNPRHVPDRRYQQVRRERNLGCGDFYHQCEQPAFLLHLRML